VFYQIHACDPNQLPIVSSADPIKELPVRSRVQLRLQDIEAETGQLAGAINGAGPVTASLQQDGFFASTLQQGHEPTQQVVDSQPWEAARQTLPPVETFTQNGAHRTTPKSYPRSLPAPKILPKSTEKEKPNHLSVNGHGRNGPSPKKAKLDFNENGHSINGNNTDNTYNISANGALYSNETYNQVEDNTDFIEDVSLMQYNYTFGDDLPDHHGDLGSSGQPGSHVVNGNAQVPVVQPINGYSQGHVGVVTQTNAWMVTESQPQPEVTQNRSRKRKSAQPQRVVYYEPDIQQNT